MKALTATLLGEEATLALGAAIALQCREGDVVALVGPLGAGKTTWTRGFVRGLELPDGLSVRSPTFTLCNEYPCRLLRVLHYDLYRLASADEADGIGFRERVGAGDVAVIEWADRFPELIPSHALWVLLEHEDAGRRVTVWEGSGIDLSWVRELPAHTEAGAPPWQNIDRPGPWEQPCSA